MNNQYQNQFALNVNNNLNFNHENVNSSTKFDLNGKRYEEDNAEEGPFDLYGIGKVKYAELHSSANKPLKKLRNIDSSVEVCPCCNSYLATKGILEPYSMCDNPDDFYNCGQGVVLYYSFLKYILAVAIIVSLGTSCINIYLSNNYYTQLTKVCNSLYENVIKNDYKLADNYPGCKFYYTDVPDTDNFNYSSIVDSFFFRFSSLHVQDYREIFEKLNTNKNKKDSYEDVVVNSSRINFITMLFLFAFNLIFIFFLYNKGKAADFLAFTVSDYAVFLYNLYDVHGKFMNIKKEINDKKEQCQKTGQNYNPNLVEFKKLGFFLDKVPSEIDQFKLFIKIKICKGRHNEDFNICKIDFSYKIEKLKKLQDKLEDKKIKISKVETFPEFQEKNKGLQGDNRKYYSGFLDFGDSDNEKTLTEIKEKKKKLEKEIDQIIEESQKNTLDYFGGTAFITFDTIQEQELYMKNVPNNAFDYFIKFFKDMAYLCSCNKSTENIYYLKRNVKFEDAPEPEDIIFENLEVSYGIRILRTIGIYIISILICGVSFVIIVLLNKVQEDINEKDTSGHITLLYVLSLVITVVTSVIDVILEIVFQTFTEWERHTTMTNFYLSYSIKITIFSFLNSGLLPLISELLINKSEGYEILISNMLMKFLVNAFVSPIMWTLSVSYYLKQAQIFLYKRKKILGTKTQKDLNTLFELPPMNVSAKYSYIFKTLLMSFLYIPIFPLGIIISLIGFAVAYWLEKINFAYYYKKPEMLNKYICEFYVSYFVVVLFAYGVGDFIFLKNIYDTNMWNYLNIIVFGVLIIIPYNRLLSRDYINFNESSIYKQKYNEAYTSFTSDYERANPMTKKEGILEYERIRKARGLISEEEYQRNIQVVQNKNFMSNYFNRPRGFGGGFGNNFMNQPPQYGNKVNIYNNSSKDPININGYNNNQPNNQINNNIYESQGIQPQTEQYGNVAIQNNNTIPNNGFYPGGPGVSVNPGFLPGPGFPGGPGAPQYNYQNGGYSSHN